ncbi:MAG: CPA2 family monovalent cation:H+ antiporter-2 [Gammaproteobacteria bacterium]|jgi:CPA2 family monovalent cation:H+ antiporter-2
MSEILLQAFIYLLAAVIAVPVAKRLGLGSVLGYLIAGVLIGPTIGLVGAETKDIQHVAEFGVVMMLFLVGLELEPKALWGMRTRLLGLGGLQVGLSSAVIAIIAFGFGVDWRSSIVVGMVLALSSTAIVLQSLNEKGLTRSDGGRASFAVLLFQDIAAIPMLAVIPLLAAPALANHGVTADAGEHVSISLVSGLSGWQVALVNLGAIGAVIVGGQTLSRPLFRYIAAANLREIFTAAALLLVIGIALLMVLVGLSPALGAFLAGVVLAGSEFRHELESDIEPFKGLLLGLFFITVGAGIDFSLLYAQFGLILGLTLGLIALKAAVLFGLSRIFNVHGGDAWLFAVALAQAGEFGFVLLAFAVQTSAIANDLAGMLLLVVALSMLFTPVLFILLDKVILPRLNARHTRAADVIDEAGPVIIAGHGRFGQIINRVLLANGYKTVVLDQQADLIDGMRRFGVQTYYGDATRTDLLLSAGLRDARLLVVAIDDADKALELIEHARRERPDLHIIARAVDRSHVYRLHGSGANDIVRETFDSSVRAARYALQALGMHPFDAEKSATVFVDHDLDAIRRLAELWDPNLSPFDNKAYTQATRENVHSLRVAMKSDRSSLHDRSDRGWIPPGRTQAEPEPEPEPKPQ